MTYTTSDVGLHYAQFDVYTEINKWLDDLVLAGKISKKNGDRISRGDVGKLNGAILEVYKKHMFTEEETK